MEEVYAQPNPNAGAPSENCVRLFGVKLTDSNHHNGSYQMGIMRKSVSMGNLGLMGFNSLQRQSGCAQSHVEFGAVHHRSDSGMHAEPQQGYASDGLMQSSSMNLRERKKGKQSIHTFLFTEVVNVLAFILKSFLLLVSYILCIFLVFLLVWFLDSLLCIRIAVETVFSHPACTRGHACARAHTHPFCGNGLLDNKITSLTHTF